MTMIDIEIAFALPNEQVILTSKVEEGTTIEQGIKKSGILDRFPDIDLAENKVGIFGQAQKIDYVLKNKDRIEIYRPITCDPKEVRRLRAKKRKKPAAKA